MAESKQSKEKSELEMMKSLGLFGTLTLSSLPKARLEHCRVTLHPEDFEYFMITFMGDYHKAYENLTPDKVYYELIQSYNKLYTDEEMTQLVHYRLKLLGADEESGKQLCCDDSGSKQADGVFLTDDTLKKKLSRRSVFLENFVYSVCQISKQLISKPDHEELKKGDPRQLVLEKVAKSLDAPESKEASPMEMVANLITINKCDQNSRPLVNVLKDCYSLSTEVSKKLEELEEMADIKQGIYNAPIIELLTFNQHGNGIAICCQKNILL